jgi:surface polysaccharide O-acyltransferase-like enzyme
MFKLIPTEINNKQVQWINYAKAIAIILIVYRHTLTGLEGAGIQVNHILLMLNDLVMSFRMPLFMMLSGLFFFGSFKKRTLASFTKNKIATILYPYILWASIQLGIQILLSDYTNHKRDLADFLFLIHHPRQLDQFWFLYALFFISIIHALLVNILKTDKIYYVVLGLILFLLNPLVENVDFLFLFFYFYVFYAIGDFLSDKLLNPKNTPKLGSLKLFLILTPVFVLMQWFWYTYQAHFNTLIILLIGLAGTAYMICLSNLLDLKKVSRLLIVIGQHSMPIYLIHVLVIAAIRIFIVKIVGVSDSVLILIVSIIFGIYIPILFYTITKNKLWWLYSLEKRKS